MLRQEQLQPHVAVGDHAPVAVMRMPRRLLDALGDGLVAQLRLQHLLLVVPQEIILHVGLDGLVQRIVFRRPRRKRVIADEMVSFSTT